MQVYNQGQRFDTIGDYCESIHNSEQLANEYDFSVDELSLLAVISNRAKDLSLLDKARSELFDDSKLIELLNKAS